MKFQVIDDYEGYDEIIGEYDTKKEANKAIRQQMHDTNGECSCYIVEVDED